MKLTNKKTQDLIKKRMQYWKDYNSDIDTLKTLEDKILKISDLSKKSSLNHIRKVEVKTEEIQSNYNSIESIANESNKYKNEVKTLQKKYENFLNLIDTYKSEIEKNKNNIKICYFLFFLIIPLFLISGFKGKINEKKEEISYCEKEISELKKKQKECTNQINELKLQSKSNFVSLKKRNYLAGVQK